MPGIGTGVAGFAIAFPIGFSASVIVTTIAGGCLLVLVGLVGIAWSLERNRQL